MGYKEKSAFKHLKKTAAAIAVIFLSLSAFLMLAHTAGRNGIAEKPIAEANIFLNKDTFHSSEEMKITANVMLPEEGNATLKIYGIPDRAGNYRVYEERNTTAGGEKNETFVFRLPSCYGCAGVAPGSYEIIMEVWQDGELTKRVSKNITLEK